MKLNKKVVIIIGVIILTILLGIGIFIGTRKLNVVVTDNPNEEIVYLTPNEIINMMSYIPHSLIRFKPYVDAYNGNNVFIKDVFPTIVSFMFLNQYISAYKISDITDANLKKVLSDEKVEDNIYIKKDVQEFLLKDYNFDMNSLKKYSNEIEYINAGDKYVAFLPLLINGVSIFNKLFIAVDTTYATKSSATIVEKALFYQLKDNKYYVYKNSNVTDDKNIIKTYNKADSNGKTLSYSDIESKIKEDFKDYNYGFKHTYKKNDTGYYWYSTEYVEINEKEK